MQSAGVEEADQGPRRLKHPVARRLPHQRWCLDTSMFTPQNRQGSDQQAGHEVEPGVAPDYQKVITQDAVSHGVDRAAELRACIQHGRIAQIGVFIIRGL